MDKSSIVEKIDHSIELLNKFKHDINEVEIDKNLLQKNLTELVSSFNSFNVGNLEPVNLSNILISSVDFGKNNAHIQTVCDEHDIVTIQELINIGYTRFRKYRNVGPGTMFNITHTLKHKYGVEW